MFFNIIYCIKFYVTRKYHKQNKKVTEFWHAWIVRNQHLVDLWISLRKPSVEFRYAHCELVKRKKKGRKKKRKERKKKKVFLLKKQHNDLEKIRYVNS